MKTEPFARQTGCQIGTGLPIKFIYIYFKMRWLSENKLQQDEFSNFYTAWFIICTQKQVNQQKTCLNVAYYKALCIIAGLTVWKKSSMLEATKLHWEKNGGIV